MTIWEELNNVNDAILHITGQRNDVVGNEENFKNHCLAPEAIVLFNTHLRGKVKTVLDFGCGIGRVMKQFKEVAPELEVTGYDYLNMQRLAELYLGEIFKQFSWVELPLENLSGKKYDLIFSSLVLQHLPHTEVDRIISFLPSILSDEGYFLHVSRGYLDGGGDVWDFVFKRFEPVDGAEQPELPDNHKVILMKVRK